MKNKYTFEVGDIVYVEGFPGTMARQTSEPEKINEIKNKFDENTGEPYQALQVGGSNWWYDGRNGNPLGQQFYFLNMEYEK